MKRPLAGLAVVYAIGIWVGSLVHWPVELLCWIAAGLLAAFLFLRRTRYALAPLLASVVAAGMLSHRGALTIPSPDHVTRLLGQRDQNVEVRGVIVSDPGDTNAVAFAHHSFKCELQAVKQNDEWRRAEGRVLVFVSEKPELTNLCYGAVIEYSAMLRVPSPARNPGTFDWQQWLDRQRIPFTTTIRKSDYCRVTASHQGRWLTALSLRLRERFERALRLGLEDEPQIAGALTAMVIGERSEIPPDTYAEFQRTGVFHVFAINGLHVGLVTAVVLIFLLAVRIPRRWCAVVAVPLLVLYVFATGAHPGAVRALMMASVWLIGGMLVRPADSLNCLGASALLILAWDPMQLFDGGFILSFTVVAAIVVLTPRIEQRLQTIVATDPFLARQFVPVWRVMADDGLRWIVRLLSCSVAAWVGLLPLMAIYFHLFTPTSVVANLLVIPLLGVIIALGLVATLAISICPWLTITFNNANYFLLTVMERGVQWLSHVPYGHQYVQAPPAWFVWAYYGLGILLLTRSIAWQWRRSVAAVAVPAVGAVALVMGVRDEAVELTVLDLSDGACIFLNAPGEQHDLVLDGGGDWSGARVVLPFLRAQGVDQLAQMVVTRADKAHVAGLCAVAREIPIGQAIHGGARSRSKYFEEWLEQVQTQHIPVRVLKAGDEWTVGGRLHVRALNPSRSSASKRSDDNSLVLAVEYGPTRVLLTSDAGESVERGLLDSGRDLRAQIVVKGRHGVEPSCTDAFLDAVQPDVVVVAAAMRPDRYPDPELRDRLLYRGVRMLRTDEAGAVTIRLTAQGYTVHSFLPAQ